MIHYATTEEAEARLAAETKPVWVVFHGNPGDNDDFTVFHEEKDALAYYHARRGDTWPPRLHTPTAEAIAKAATTAP